MAASATDTNRPNRKKRSELIQYYTNEKQQHSTVPPSIDLLETDFDPKNYANKLIKNCSLKELLEEEAKLASSAHSLDSDCQTLVYEHYDKFLHATDLVHKLKEGSSEMESQLEQLQSNMKQITESSCVINEGLQDRRSEFSKLLEVHNTLNKLEFLYELPSRMEKYIAEGEMCEAVECYLSTRDLLKRYKHLSSLSAVQIECEKALKNLKEALYLSLAQGSSKDLASCVELLLQLGEPKQSLQDSFLKQAQSKLNSELDDLKSLASPSETSHRKESLGSTDDNEKDVDASPAKQRFSHDLLEFMDACQEGHGAALWLLISSYQEMFLSEGTNNEASQKLKSLVHSSIEEMLEVVKSRIEAEVKLSPLHTNVMATALDKLHRRLKAVETMMGQTYYTQWSATLILMGTELQCEAAFNTLSTTLINTLADVRQGIAMGGIELQSVLSHLVASTAAAIKENISLLLSFINTQCSFSSEDGFRRTFIVKQVREGTVIRFLKHLSATLSSFCGSGSTSGGLLLVMARASYDLHTSTAHYLLRECDELLGVLKMRSEAEVSRHLTPSEEVTSELKHTAQKLLDAYVRKQGSALAQLLVRSVDLKEWLVCGEPRSVRRVMKTVKEDIEAHEVQVGVLYEEGTRKERSSDSSRRTFHSTSLTGASHHRGSAPFSTSGARLNLSKLWCDRIEIFSPVSPDKLSIVTGIVKIALKSLEESLRLRTLSKFGLQQVQVDVHYLRTHLWRHVNDDSLLNVMLDEIITAAAVRCCDAQMMEHSVVEFICEQ